MVVPVPAASIISPMIEVPSHGLLAAGYPDVGVEPLDGLHELGRGAGVQTLLVANLQPPGRWRPAGARKARWDFFGGAGWVAHLPLRTRLAMGDVFAPSLLGRMGRPPGADIRHELWRA